MCADITKSAVSAGNGHGIFQHSAMVRPLASLVSGPVSGPQIVRKGRGSTESSNNHDQATRVSAGRRSSGGTVVAPANPTSYSIDEMSKISISTRTLHNSSVHHSVSANKWIATIDMGDRLVLSLDDVHRARRNTLTFPFDDERSARKFCTAYAPPRMMQPTTDKPSCVICRSAFARKGKKDGVSGWQNAGRPHFTFCRNCGVPVCPANCKRGCSTTWAVTMLPKTYTMNENLTHVSVCSSCDWLSNAFCVSLLKGRLDDVKTLFKTGNVNLRCSFADINGEAMFPVHCAVMGGDLEVMKWLVESQCVPISVERRSGVGAANGYSQTEGQRTSVLTSKGRSVLDLAVVPGRRRMEIVRYLIVERQMSLVDAKNSKMALNALEGYLREAHHRGDGDNDGHRDVPKELTGGGIKVSQSIRSDDESSSFVQSVEDPCVLCYERSMADCVLIPCGHQMCCFECGRTLSKCPVCSKDCSVLRVFRP